MLGINQNAIVDEHDQVVLFVASDVGDGSLARGGDQHDDCYVVDYDADGDYDLIVCRHGGPVSYYENTGTADLVLLSLNVPTA